ncbi:MAG: DAK2 domain-containing protein [Ornithinimicrobium sp.]
MTTTALDLAAARRWAVTSRALLSEVRAQIDELNVFPVPDGDTGTNMFLTVDGALGFLRDHDVPAGGQITLGEGLALLARGMLLSARGNSGVILSQLALGMAQAVARVGPDTEHISPQVLREAFARAADVAWSGVSVPVEGTILSVSRAAAQGAAAVLRPSAADQQHSAVTTHDVAAAALESARIALAMTPEQLPSLARAGVVDAGGAGFVVVLEALESVLAGRVHEGTVRDASSWRSTQPRFAPAVQCVDDEGAYEVMFVLDDCSAKSAESLRHELTRLGSSVMVVGGPPLWRVHVHLDHPSDAIDAGSHAGQVEQVAITALTRSVATSRDVAVEPMLGLVCCAPGDGLAQVFTEAGADVVPSRVGNRASIGQLLHAARESPAHAVAILPNDPDTILAAQAAARAGAEEGLRISVVPTSAAVQGLAAVSVWDRDTDDLAHTLDAMHTAARDVRYGALTVAASDGVTPVGPCRAGQWLGLVTGDIIAVHDDVADAAYAVLTAMAAGAAQDVELLTVVEGSRAGHSGSEPDGAIGPILQRWSAQADPSGEVEVRHIMGGQRTYHWLLGME